MSRPWNRTIEVNFFFFNLGRPYNRTAQPLRGARNLSIYIYLFELSSWFFIFISGLLFKEEIIKEVKDNKNSLKNMAKMDRRRWAYMCGKIGVGERIWWAFYDGPNEYEMYIVSFFFWESSPTNLFVVFLIYFFFFNKGKKISLGKISRVRVKIILDGCNICLIFCRA